VKRIVILLVIVLLAASNSPAQQPTDNVASDPRLKRFDTNGDGKIDDEERRAIREFMRQRGRQKGSMTMNRLTKPGGLAVAMVGVAEQGGVAEPASCPAPYSQPDFIPILGEGHGWPMQKGRDATDTGPKTRDISAPEEFWKFFQSVAQRSSAQPTQQP